MDMAAQPARNASLIDNQMGNSAAEAAPRWSALHRIGFRFLCVYLLLYVLSAMTNYGFVWLSPFGNFFGPLLGNSVHASYDATWDAVLPWVGLHLFHLSAREVGSVGVFDGMSQNIQIFCELALAFIGTVIWSILDRRRPHYRILHSWLRLLIRYILGFVLLSYGFSKLFPIQFKPTSFSDMMTPYGEFRTYDILWTFMGASQLYIIFTGAVEVAGALLLLFRRTTTLGALVSFTALLNVFMLNVSYHLNVKLFSLHFLLMSAFLLTPELKPLLDLLLLRRAAAPVRNTEPLLHRRPLRIAATILWVLVVSCRLYSEVGNGWYHYKLYYINPERPPLLGLYEVQSFKRGGQELPPLMTDSTRWYMVAFDTSWSGKAPGSTTVRMMDGRAVGSSCEFDSAHSSVALIRRDRTGRILGGKDELTYSWPDADHVLMEGRLGVGWRGQKGDENDLVSILLRKVDTSNLPIKRWAHRARWIVPSR